MNIRVLISLTLAVSFCVLSVSGLFSFFLPYNRTTAAVHSIFGFLFIAAVIPHILNNLRNLKSYIRKRQCPSEKNS